MAGAIYDQTTSLRGFLQRGLGILRDRVLFIIRRGMDARISSGSAGRCVEENCVNLKLEGNCWKFGHNIPTDLITPTAVVMRGMAEMVKHVLESANPEFLLKVQKGDIIVAGRNFGMLFGPRDCAEGDQGYRREFGDR